MVKSMIIKRENLNSEEKDFYDTMKKISTDDNFLLAVFTYTKKSGAKEKLIEFIKKYPEASRDDVYKEVIINHYGYDKEKLITEYTDSK